MYDDKTIRKINKCIVGIAKNNRRALEELFNLTKKQLLIVAKTYLFDKSKAEDVLSESYFQAVKNAKSFNPRYSGYSWLYEIVKNTAYNQNKKDKVRSSLPLDEISEPSIDPIEQILNEILVEEALVALTDEAKQTVYKYFFEGKTLKEIAAELNKPKTTVYDNIQKIISLMRDNIDEND